MSQPQWLELLSIPLIAGIVGYATNKLAIKMLFRPYSPKWYTLGWQGIVPRSRAKLAELIGNMVAKKLLSPNDIALSFKNKIVTNNIQKFIENKLKNITFSDIDKALSLVNLEKLALDNKSFIDSYGQSLIIKAIEPYLSRPIPTEKITKVLLENVDTENISQVISEHISAYMLNLQDSGERLEDILPQILLSKKALLSRILADKASVIIKSMGRSAAVKEAAAEKVIDFKNSFFANNGKMDFIKMGFINMVLDDETISNTVKRELPGIMDGLADDKNIRQKIYEKINEEIELFLNSTIKDLLTRLGEGSEREIKSLINNALNSQKFQKIIHQSLSSIISKFGLKYKDKSFNDALIVFGFDVSSIINKFSVVDFFILYGNSIKQIFYERVNTHLSGNAVGLATIITDKSINLLHENLPMVLENINISKTVEDKINAMSLAEVEDVLFSFMKSHFKWINRLGFILGFIIGAIQASFIYFTR